MAGYYDHAAIARSLDCVPRFKGTGIERGKKNYLRSWVNEDDGK